MDPGCSPAHRWWARTAREWHWALSLLRHVATLAAPTGGGEARAVGPQEGENPLCQAAWSLVKGSTLAFVQYKRVPGVVNASNIPGERRIGELPVEHPLRDDVVRFLRQLHAVPAGKVGRVTPNLGRAIALGIGVVGAAAAATCNQRITNTESAGILDEFHGGAIVVGIDELHIRVGSPEHLYVPAKRLVVIPGEGVEPPEAAVLVVLPVVVAAEATQKNDQTKPPQTMQCKAHLDEMAYVYDDILNEVNGVLASSTRVKP
ncbi:hypothetical protein U9M48_026421 [Paspalum notatum var. saurae]|uniref:Uncharacterized protein n=1 Tax=Paspalum notatum var. saurae TaxID=547442 RepID=A0AAQ3TS81_PASNO